MCLHRIKGIGELTWLLGMKCSISSFKESILLNVDERTICNCNRDEDWEDNDGALNTISMTHPRIPTEHPNHFVVDDSECHPLRPGIWFVLTLPFHYIYC